MTGMGIHLLDAYSFLVGPMRRVSALSARRQLPLESGDITAALIEFRGGATATIKESCTRSPRSKRCFARPSRAAPGRTWPDLCRCLLPT